MRDLVVPALLLMTVVTAMGSAYAKHESRKLFQELQALEAERDAMNVEWGQLQLEQSTHTSHGSIRAKLNGSTASPITKSTNRPVIRSSRTVPTEAEESVSWVSSSARTTSPPNWLGRKLLKNCPTK